ncbi:hypothetical protein BCON_0151g00100 [Botryotinia convoluta]|uniref:Uncharacterized protein n=1 Tax=Botryotinia convoluta TaxID=54673 RepID=A0A4Z1HS95_9HELO|nr:hypothetical protein BCON_0151g00100 [Botryotinia convoluta]
MSEQSEYNSQASEASHDNGFSGDFDDLFNKAYEEEADAAAAAALAPTSERQASAMLAGSDQANVDSEADGFFYDFEMDIEKASEEEQGAAAAAALASEPQAENGQVDEDSEGNGFSADFNMDFDEAYEEEQRAAAAVAVKTAQQANARLAENLGMRLPSQKGEQGNEPGNKPGSKQKERKGRRESLVIKPVVDRRSKLSAWTNGICKE